MTCDAFKLGDDGFAIVCSRGRKERACQFCGGRRAQLLCDRELAGKKAGKTCDAPMCARCAIQIGKDKHLCPPHARERDTKQRYADAQRLAVETKPEREAAAWLAGVIADEERESNEVDHDAIALMFPGWRDEVESCFDDHGNQEPSGARFSKVGSLRANAVSGDVNHESIGDLIARSSIGAALRDIKEHGIDAHLDELEREQAARSQSISTKVAHVKRAGQTRSHRCHWVGCEKQCPPAMWGCRDHWYALPKYLRDKIWREYRAGQEATLTPSRAYLDVADEVERWIIEHQKGK